MQNNTNGVVTLPEGWGVDPSTYLHQQVVEWWGSWGHILTFKTGTQSYVELKTYILPSTVLWGRN